MLASVVVGGVVRGLEDGVRSSNMGYMRIVCP